jgi:ribulose-phosphate 3-epimerase
MTGVVKLAPSILSADFARLGEQVQEAEQAGADRIHVDVMDGHFVPNLALGAPVVASLRRITRLPLEIHMMVSAPDLFLGEFAAAGADSFLVHWEGNNNLHRTVQRIKELRKRPGVVINPATSVAVLENILQDVTQVLIMTVDPGFAHQRFITTTLPKIRRVRRMIELAKARCEVEVDGGIDAETAPLAVTAGADVLVAGTAIFNEGETVAKAMNRLRASVQQVHEQRQVA